MGGDEWDTLVLGSGVLGCATAYHLKRVDPDRGVLLLDRNPRPAMGNTRRSVALFRELFTSSTSRDLAGSTIAFLDHLEGELGHGLGLRRTGYYWMMGEARLKAMRGALGHLEDLGLDLEVHGPGEVADVVGGGLVMDPVPPPGTGPLEPVAGAMMARNAGTLSPTRLARWYEAQFRSLGGRVEYGFPVERLVPASGDMGGPRVWEPGRVEAVEGPSGRRRAREMVVALGAWTPSLLDPIGVDVHVKPQTRQAFGLVGPGTRTLHASNGFPEGRLPVLVLPSAGVYLKPVPSQGMLLAGCADTLGRSYALDDDPRPEEDFLRDQVRPVVEAYLPGLRGSRTPVSWAGQYHQNTLDGNPLILRRWNLTVVVGASGSGVMKSDAIGRVAAAAHLGEREAELFDGRRLLVADLGVRDRRVEPEGLII